jgi:hypothetical protein
LRRADGQEGELMARHAKTQRIIVEAHDILAEYHPMTLRQVYYQLVARQVMENSRGAYQSVSDALSAARREGLIPWAWMEDRLRRPRYVQMWSSPQEWADGLEDRYVRDVWAEQPRQIELWLEKDALSGVFLEAVGEYRVTLNVGRGYDGWDSIHNAAVRFGDGSNTIVLYFGDFDPSGEDMVRSLRERLAELGCRPEILKCALNPDDIQRYHLPPNLTKPSDS